MKTLVLKNKQFDILAKILGEDLPFQRSRRRKIFIDAVLPKMKARDEARMDIIKKYGKKDDKGELVVEKGNFAIEDIPAFQKDYEEMMEEDVIIDISPSIEQIIDSIKDIVNTTDITVKNDEVLLIEDIITAFNNIK